MSPRVKDPPRRHEDATRARGPSPVVVGVIAAAWAMAVVIAHGDHRALPFAEQANIARHLALGHGYRSPMNAAADAPLSAWSPPIYPVAIATAYRLLGMASPPAVVALLLVNAVCFAAIVTATVALSDLIFRSRIPGAIAAAVLAVHPLFRAGMGDFWDGFLALAIFSWLTVAAVRLGGDVSAAPRRRQVRLAMFGAGLGLLALTNASYAIAFPVLLWMACRGPALAPRLVAAAVAAAACLAIAAPWTLRNYAAFGRLVPIRTGAGVQFWIGNPPVSGGWLDQPAFAAHPYANPSERALMLQIGEPAYDDLVFDRFEAATIARPTGYLAACLRRAIYLLVGNPTRPGRDPFLVAWDWDAMAWRSLMFALVVAVLGLGGMTAARRAGYAHRGLPVLAASVGLPFVVSAMTDRYSLPLRWLLVFYAGACIWMIRRR